MPEMTVGPQPSEGIGGIPTKYVLIGAGVLGVGAILLLSRKGSSAPAQSGDVQPTGSTSAQLSSLQQMQLEQFGEITKLFRSQQEREDTALGGLSAHLDTNAANLTSFLQSLFGTQAEYTGNLAQAIQNQLAIIMQGQANLWNQGRGLPFDKRLPGSNTDIYNGRTTNAPAA